MQRNLQQMDLDGTWLGVSLLLRSIKPITNDNHRFFHSTNLATILLLEEGWLV
jgi:hypothetical protein